jgi:circadian clock protein KaiC
VPQLARLESGIEGLDCILHGGFVRSASYIIQGRPGAGKTILSNQIAFAHAAAGGNVLYVTLLAETHERLFQAMSTLDFFDESKLGQQIRYVSVFHTLRNEGLDAVVKLLRQETKRHNATLLVFDGLLNARERADSDIDVKTFVASIQDQAGFVGCTVLFLTSTREDSSNAEHTMVDGVIELSEDIVGVRTVRQLQVKKSRGSGALGGLHQYEITRAGVTLYPRLESLNWKDEEPEMPPQRIGTGIDKLDVLVGGGLPPGSVTLLVGATGTGKTSLGLHFLGAQGGPGPALHFGFFEGEALLRRKAEALGIALPADEQLAVIWNPLRENLLDKLGLQLLDHVVQRRVSKVFIDGMGGFERANTYRPRLVEFMSTLTNRLRALGVTTVLTWELREIIDRDISVPSEHISAMFDNVIILRHIELHSNLQRAIAVEKMRDSSFDTTTHALEITNQGVRIGGGVSFDPQNR